MIGGNGIEPYTRVGGSERAREGKDRRKRGAEARSQKPKKSEGRRARASMDKPTAVQTEPQRKRRDPQPKVAGRQDSAAPMRAVGKRKSGKGKGIPGSERDASFWRRLGARKAPDRSATGRSLGGRRRRHVADGRANGQYDMGRLLGCATIGFVCGFATLFGAYSPFGIVAVTAALFGWNMAYAMPVIAGALAGTALGTGISSAVGLAISAALVEVIRKPLWPYLTKDSPPQTRNWAIGALVLLCSFIGSALAYEISGLGLHVLVVSLVESTLAGSAAAVVVPSAALWAREGRVRAPGRFESASFLVVMAVACAGLDSISFAGISPGAAVGLYAAAIAGTLAGPGAGAIVGASLGVGLSISRAGQGILIGVLTLAGAASGIVSKQGRAITAFSMLVAATLSGYQLRTAGELTARMIEAAVAALGFLLTPDWLLSELSWRLPDEVGPYGRGRKRMHGAHHLVLGKLSVLGKTFRDLAAAYQGGPIEGFSVIGDEGGESCTGGGGGPVHASSGISSGFADGSQLKVAWISDVQEIDDPFEAGNYDSPGMRAARAVAFVRAQACKGCPRYDVCWRDMVFRTYRDLVDLLAAIELFGEGGIASLPEGFKKRCMRTEKVIAASLTATGRRRAGAFREGLQGKEGQQRAEAVLDKSSTVSILALQMVGVADAICRVSSQAQGMARFDEEAESLIRRKLSSMGMDIRNVRVSWSAHGGFEVDIVKAPCRQDGECVRAVAPVVGDVLGRPVSVWQADCFYTRAGGKGPDMPDPNGDGDVDESFGPASPAAIGIGRLWRLKPDRGRSGECRECSIRLLPARKYDLESEVVTLPSTLGEVSGDSHAVVNLGDGRMAVMIADGMGVGEAASEESSAAVAMLARLLVAGLDLDFAVQSVNSVMLLRSDDEKFTTLDLVVVDLYTGQTEIVKAGAPPSFIKRGYDVIAVGDPSVPAGILAPTRAMRYRTNLEEGDMLIMVSDGVTEARDGMDGVGKELIRVMERADCNSPREVAADVADWARGDDLDIRQAHRSGSGARGLATDRQGRHGASRQGSGLRGRNGRADSAESRDDMTVLAVRLSLAADNHR